MRRGPAPFATRCVSGVLLFLIHLYRRLVSPVIPALFGPACGCRFYPTCSHYAADAVRWHGPLRGGWLAFRRLLRCTPLSAGGIDPVPAPEGGAEAESADATARSSAPKAPAGPAPWCVRVR